MPGQSLETGQSAVTGGWGHGGVYEGAVVAAAPAVCLKVRVTGGIEGRAGKVNLATHSSGSLVVFGQTLRTELRVTLTRHTCSHPPNG